MTATRASSGGTDQQWADHPLANDTNWLLHRVAFGLGAAEARACAEHGVGIRGYVVLTYLSGSEPATQQAVGHAIGLDKTTVTGVIDDLVAQGLVVREVDGRDRRARVPVVTDKGRRVLAELATAVRSVEQELLDELSGAQQHALQDALRRLAFGRFAETVTPSGSCL